MLDESFFSLVEGSLTNKGEVKKLSVMEPRGIIEPLGRYTIINLVLFCHFYCAAVRH